MMLRRPVFVLVPVAFGLAAGCFNPKFKEGIACDPNGACPSGLSCSPQCICEENASVDASLPPGLTGRWMLADGSGTAASDMLGAHPAVLNGEVTWSQDPAHCVTAAFDGSTGYFATSAPVMTTNASYTVSAWVKLTDISMQHTILSQEGSTRSPFYLQYDKDSFNWRLYISSADVSSPTWYTAASTTITPQVGVWTHLVGVYDSVAKTVKLYINGQAQGSDSNVTTWNATGVTWIGRSKTTWFQGNLSDVQIYSRALSAIEATNL